MDLKKKNALIAGGLLAVMLLQTGCGGEPAPAETAEATPAPVESTAPAVTPAPAETSAPEKNDQIADKSEMAEIEDVVEEDMVPLTADQLQEGTYDIAVASSSSMFKIVKCQLTVADGKMTAAMTMGGTGYRYIYMGTGEEAVAADEADYLHFQEDADGAHVYTVEVEALDAPVDCAAFSDRKEKWYDRTLVFRADSLPMEALPADMVTLPSELALADGDYTVEVALKGGSGRSSVASPAKLHVAGGVCTAEIVWSSQKYDYMKIGETMYEPTTLEPGSTFVLPVAGFDWKIAVIADTTAMSEPHEIAYTLTFDSATITPAG